MSGLDTPMNFELVRDAFRATLKAGAVSGGHPGRFRVTGSQKQRTGDNEILNLNRTVQIYYEQGGFSGSDKQQLNHEATYEIKLSCSADTKADLATLDNDASTPAEITAAFDNIELATDRVEDSIDELWRMVIQIMEDPANEDYGLTPGTVDTVRLTNFLKSDVMEKGDLVSIHGKATLTCNMDETLSGVTPTELQPGDQPAINTESKFKTLSDDPDDTKTTPAKISIDTDTTET
jgi:hypothetical protein